MSGYYSLSDVLRLAGVTRSQLVRWIDAGVVTPAADAGLGKGHRRKFSLMNVAEACIARELAAFRIVAPKMKGLVALACDTLQHRSRIPLLWITGDGRVLAAQAKDNLLLQIALNEIAREVECATGERLPIYEADGE